MNPDMIDILEATLSRGFRALILTNAMRPMAKMQGGLKRLRVVVVSRFGLTIFVLLHGIGENKSVRKDGVSSRVMTNVNFLGSL